MIADFKGETALSLSDVFLEIQSEMKENKLLAGQ